MSNEQLLDDVKTMLEDTEALLAEGANETGEKAVALRERVIANLQQARVRVMAAEEVVVSKAKVAATVADGYVRERPWQSIGLAAGVGFLLGLLVSRR